MIELWALKDCDNNFMDLLEAHEAEIMRNLYDKGFESKHVLLLHREITEPQTQSHWRVYCPSPS